MGGPEIVQGLIAPDSASVHAAAVKVAKKLPATDYLLKVFAYDPLSGSLTWRESGNKHCDGDRAGWNDGRYIEVHLDGEVYYAHRIVWKMMTGQEPRFIDHENLNRADLRWVNLRDGTKSQNQGNRLARSDNTSGYKNIQWCEDRKRWLVQVKNSGVKMTKRTKTLAGAIAFRRLAISTLFGEFARVA